MNYPLRKEQIMNDRLLKESDVLRIAFQLPLVVNSAFTNAVKALPSTDRPSGEWIAVSSYDAFGGSEELWNAHGNSTAFHYCSKCKAQSYVNEFGEELLTDFCPNCGAKMKGADNEID